MSTAPHRPTDAANEAQAAVPVARSEVEDAARRFEAAAEKAGIDRPPTGELRQLCRQVAEFTSQLFPGAAAVEVRVDPEIVDDLYFVFEVRATGSVDDVVARDREWHRRLAAVARTWPGLFRLSIDVT